MKQLLKKTLDQILAGKDTVAIGGHIRPDGDCVGSCMGLYLYLKENYRLKEIHVFLEDFPESFSIIKDTEEIIHDIPDMQFDLFICLDCGDIDRLGSYGKIFNNAKHTLCIDHHISNQRFAEYNHIIPDASSTCELVFDLLDVTKISLHSAEALYMGIAHDTGVFQYSCTSPSTMEAAAQLLSKGIDANYITDKTYYQKSYAQNQILGKALLESMMLLDHKCIASVVTLKDMAFFEVKPKDLDGIVSQLRNTKNIEVAIFLYELEPQSFKVSLRSNGNVDVSKICQYFGGGGHVRAAGCSMAGSSYDILNNIIRQIDLQMKSSLN